MALTVEEKARARYHLGYLNVSTAHGLALGLVSANHMMFILDRNMDAILPEAEPLVRRALHELQCIEDQLSQSRENYGVRRVEEISFDGNHEGRLADQYIQWAETLSDTLGAPINPFSRRHSTMRGEVTLTEPM